MRRFLPYSSIVFAGVLAAACGNTPNQPSLAQPGAASLDALAASAGNGNGKPEIDPTWANGQTVYMIGPHLIVDAKDTQPNLYAKAQELYLVVFPQTSVPQPGAGPITLPSGYRPQCNPCFHPGLPFPFVYHDHVITGAPGMGNNGTAGEFKAPWKVIVLQYTTAYANSVDFKPITSAADIDTAETTGGIFAPIAPPGSSNAFEIETGNVLICPIASGKA